jgi:short-subunit dehydrogenase
VARGQGALDEAAARVTTETRTLALDLSDHGAAETLIGATDDIEVGLLVYNAGADPNASKFLDKPASVWEALTLRNCNTLLVATHHFASRMAGRGHGGIVLVTSGAAWAGGAYVAAYGASKAFDLILGEALWSELRPLGIDVLSMVLGPTDTPAFRRGHPTDDFAALANPDDVARNMLDHLANGPTFPPDASPFGSLPRREAVERMSRASSARATGAG